MKNQIIAGVFGIIMLSIVAYFAAKTCPLMDTDQISSTEKVHTTCKPPIVEEPENDPYLVLALPALEPEQEYETIELPETPFLGKDISVLEPEYRSEATR